MSFKKNSFGKKNIKPFVFILFYGNTCANDAFFRALSMSKKLIFLAGVAFSGAFSFNASAMDPDQKDTSSVPSAAKERPEDDADKRANCTQPGCCDEPYTLSPKAKKILQDYNASADTDNPSRGDLLGLFYNICKIDLNVTMKPEQCQVSFKEPFIKSKQRGVEKLSEAEVVAAMEKFIKNEPEAFILGPIFKDAKPPRPYILANVQDYEFYREGGLQDQMRREIEEGQSRPEAAAKD